MGPGAGLEWDGASGREDSKRIAADKAKEVTKAIKESKLKVQGQIQGEQVRVLSKSKDDLQSAMAFLKTKILGLIYNSPTTASRDAERGRQLRSRTEIILDVPQ